MPEKEPVTVDVGSVPGGLWFAVYGQPYIKINRDHKECAYIGYASKDKEAHGYAIELRRGIVVQFPVSTQCRPLETAVLFGQESPAQGEDAPAPASEPEASDLPPFAQPSNAELAT